MNQAYLSEYQDDPENKDALIKKYLESRLGPQPEEDLESMRNKQNLNVQMQRDAASANLMAGLNNASAMISGGRYKADNSDLLASNKDRAAQIDDSQKQMAQGQQLAQKDRHAAISEYLSGKKQNENMEFQKKRLEADNQYRQDNLNAQAENRKEMRDHRTFLTNEAVARKKEIDDRNLSEKEQALQTPYGLANTIDDAKKLKAAHESKTNFDNKISEMIALREKHGGGAILNREDVARGQQLSKDLLLEYKNMVTLGVLSESDKNILDKIIPNDPLEYKMAGIIGQDPILSNLKAFKGDSQRDFDTKVSTRTRKGLAEAGKKIERKVVDRQVNPKQPGKMKLVYSDGSSEIVDTGRVANNGASGGF